MQKKIRSTIWKGAGRAFLNKTNSTLDPNPQPTHNSPLFILGKHQAHYIFPNSKLPQGNPF